jgi:hypothetical protein
VPDHVCVPIRKVGNTSRYHSKSLNYTQTVILPPKQDEGNRDAAVDGQRRTYATLLTIFGYRRLIIDTSVLQQ